MSKQKKDRAWELLDAIGEADEKFVADASYKPKKKAHRRNFRRYGLMAACLALVLLLPVMIVSLLPGGNGNTVSVNNESSNEAAEASGGESSDRTPGTSESSETSETSGPSGDPRPVVGGNYDLMAAFHPGKVEAQELDDGFLQEQMRFSLALFQQAAKGEQAVGNSLLLSPLSAQLALSMAANGAVGQTQTEMLSLLGGNLSMARLNGYLHTLMEGLAETGDADCKVNIANAIWYNDWVEVYADFLQTNADYYGAGAFQAPFDEETKQKINAWVSEQTDGMIRGAMDKINPEAAMYLLNAILFDGEWWSIYTKDEVWENTFATYDGKKQTVSFMYSEEGTYYDDGRATGFAKAYKGGKYAFVALLPNEGVDVYDYVASLTPEGLLHTLQTGKKEAVKTSLPKFSYAYDSKLTELLGALGMESAFDPKTADFTNMLSGGGYLSSVNQKTVISVGEVGTKAAAVTVVEAPPTSSPEPPKYRVYLNRPFVYMIVDQETKLPLFLGVQTEIDDSGVPEGDASKYGEDDPYEGTPPSKEPEDYTGLTVSVEPITEGEPLLYFTFENGSNTHFNYYNTDLLLQRRTENGYEDFPFIGEPDLFASTVWRGERSTVRFRPEKDFGVTLRAGEVYRLVLTNLPEGRLSCEFTVGEAKGELQLTIRVEDGLEAGQKYVLYSIQNTGKVDFVFGYRDILVQHLTEDGWESFSLADDSLPQGDLLIRAGGSHETLINMDHYGVVLRSGETYRLALANAPGVCGEFIIE